MVELKPVSDKKNVLSGSLKITSDFYSIDYWVSHISAIKFSRGWAASVLAVIFQMARIIYRSITLKSLSLKKSPLLRHFPCLHTS